MKNFLSKIVIVFIFVFGFSFFFSYKSEAAVTANIDASSTSVAVGSGQVAITYSSSGADSCTLNGSPVSNSGTYYFTPSSVGSFTFRIECKHLVVEPKYYYYQLSPCYYGNPAAEYYAPAGAWQSGTLVQGASGVYYTVAGSNNTDNPSKWNVSGITKETNWALCR